MYFPCFLKKRVYDFSPSTGNQCKHFGGANKRGSAAVIRLSPALSWKQIREKSTCICFANCWSGFRCSHLPPIVPVNPPMRDFNPSSAPEPNQLGFA